MARQRGFSACTDDDAVAVVPGARHLVMFHHDQDYSDDKVYRLRDACRAELDV